MNQEIKDKWVEMVQDESLNTPADWLYILLNPTDKREFFKIVGTIVEQHMPNDTGKNQIWASSHITKFKMTAVEYLIEFENDNSDDSYPVYPVYPVQPDTQTWKPGIVYCTTTRTTT